MVFEPSSRVLFIFAGQRDGRYLSDMYTYDITTNVATELYSDFSTAGGPNACFTQRAVIEPALKELYVYVAFRTPTTSLSRASECCTQILWPNKDSATKL